MSYRYSKDKLFKGRSYAIGRSLLDSFFEENNIDNIDSMGYWVKRPFLAWESGWYGDEVLMRAFYSGLGTVSRSIYPGTLAEYPPPGKVVIGVYSISSDNRNEYKNLYESQVLPALERWLSKVRQTKSPMAGRDNQFIAYIKDGNLVSEDHAV